jgi:hypothetical protein
VATTAPTTSTTAAEATAPLTGLPIFNRDIASRPAVMIKVGDDPKARPQSGLDKADVVYEERVEGNTVRFLTVFQSRDATSVGPIRSVRSTDAGVVSAIGGVFVYSGGIPPFESLVRKVSGLTIVTEGDHGDAFHLRADKQRPYKTYASTAELRAVAPSSAAPPPALFPFLSEGQPLVAPGGTAATQATVTFGPGTVARWDWDPAAGRWKRSINGAPQRVEGGGQLAFTNVIIQRVGYRGTPYRDQANAAVDEAITSGSGEATLLTGGQSFPLRWSKSGDKSLTVFTDASGRTLRVPPGQTWIALVPTDAQVAVVNPSPVGATGTTRLGSQ